MLRDLDLQVHVLGGFGKTRANASGKMGAALHSIGFLILVSTHTPQLAVPLQDLGREGSSLLGDAAGPETGVGLCCGARTGRQRPKRRGWW